MLIGSARLPIDGCAQATLAVRHDPGKRSQPSPKFGREPQIDLCQLDFNLPERFNLRFRGPEQPGSTSDNQFQRPVMIHRAILGSVERFIAIITESSGGKW
jgi:threonyl-tRNA synthetase